MRSSLLAAFSITLTHLSWYGLADLHSPRDPSGFDRDVVKGAPIPGNYGGQYRPQVHFSPPQKFLNDPNGLFRDDDGIWHLYYQYNPTDLVAGNQHWGHATSRDLYHWVNQPIALFPPSPDVLVFSGSAVIDRNNTSGLFPNQKNGVVAIYTLASPSVQSQAIAYSHDGGYTFTPYQGNPVIPGNSSQFRDPKVIWYQDHWVMAVAYPVDFAVGIFTSTNLIDWTPASNFSHHGLLGLQWECPNLVKVPFIDDQGIRHDDMWLMVVSINPGAPLGGSVTQYYPGTFDGTHFRPVDSAARFLDFAKDNYAGQFFYNDAKEDPVLLAWASNWQYTGAVPTDSEGWRSAMSLPRRTYLTTTPRSGWKLVQEPYDLSPVLGDVLLSDNKDVNARILVDFAHVPANALYWEANVTGLTDGAAMANAVLNFTFVSPNSGERVRGGYFFDSESFYLDRGGARGFDNAFFTDKFSVDSVRSKNSWNMRGVFDRSMIEVFLDGGVDSATGIFFSEQPLTQMELVTSNLPKNARVSLLVTALRSAWGSEESSKDARIRAYQSPNHLDAQEVQQMMGIV
ncbi:hypothetical protein HIM_00878 [Hirsutella minnesotensis 3608]|nr:hypothetical protein HIM_00878 [Hirsutella minnesotensis 3608]